MSARAPSVSGSRERSAAAAATRSEAPASEDRGSPLMGHDLSDSQRAPRLERERQQVEAAGDEEQGAIADDQREVLQRASEQRAEQVRAEGGSGSAGVREPRGEDQVGAEDGGKRQR